MPVKMLQRPVAAIRPLDPTDDLDRVETFYREAQDYWMLADGRAPDRAKARAFFTDGPPGCDPNNSHRLGLFLEERLSGVAELSVGFPATGDPYLGLMLLGPWARGLGHGAVFLAHIEALARANGAKMLYLAVLEANPQGRAFWERQGFRATGLSGETKVTGAAHVLHRMAKPL